MGSVDHALQLLKEAGAVEVTVRFQLGAVAPPPAPVASADPAPQGNTSAEEADEVDEFYASGSRPVRREEADDDF